MIVYYLTTMNYDFPDERPTMSMLMKKKIAHSNFYISLSKLDEFHNCFGISALQQTKKMNGAKQILI